MKRENTFIYSFSCAVVLKIVIFKYTRKQRIYVANGYGSLRLSDSTFLSYEFECIYNSYDKKISLDTPYSTGMPSEK